MVWLARFGEVMSVVARSGKAGEVRPAVESRVLDWQGRPGMVRSGRCGEVGRGRAGFGMAGWVRPVRARHGAVRIGKAGTVRPGRFRYGELRRGF